MTRLELEGAQAAGAEGSVQRQGDDAKDDGPVRDVLEAVNDAMGVVVGPGISRMRLRFGCQS